MAEKELNCSFIDNLVDGDYQHNHSFFMKTVNAFCLESLYLYDMGVRSYTLMDKNAETNLYFLQVVTNTLNDVPKLFLFSPCKDYVGKDAYESKAVKFLVDEVVYMRQKATNDPAIFEMLYKAVIDNSDILSAYVPLDYSGRSRPCRDSRYIRPQYHCRGCDRRGRAGLPAYKGGRLHRQDDHCRR